MRITKSARERALMKLDLEKLVLLAAAILVAAVVAMVARGGGYGIAGLSWSTNLEVTLSSLRIGPYTVLEGDRIRSVNSRPVRRDADLRAVLRAVEADDIWLEVERADYQVAVPLTPEAIERDNLPAILRGPYEVVRIDDREIRGDMNLAVMASWMDMNGGQPAVFTVSVPDYTFEGAARRVRRPGPITPLVLLVLALGMVVLAWLRGRREVMKAARDQWQLLAVSLASGGVLLAFLAWHDGVMADPVLLPFAVAALCSWRPLSLLFHHAGRGRLWGSANTYFRLGVGLPAAILMLASLYGWIRTLTAVSGSPLDGFVYDQLRLLILIGAAATALYHVADLALQVADRRGRGWAEWTSPSAPRVGTVLGALFIVSAMVGWAANPSGFLIDGFVPHLAGLVAVQCLGDLAVLPRRSDGLEVPLAELEGPVLEALLLDARDTLGLSDPQFVCRLEGASAVLALEPMAVPDDLPPTSNESGRTPAGFRLVVRSLDERLAGMLELLDAEGGMFPRYKTVRGTDEEDDDPFDGLERTVGVELVLPLDAPEDEDDGLLAHLISRSEADEPAVVTPSSEALDEWRGRLAAQPGVWARLRAVAAEGALELLARERRESSGEVIAGVPPSASMAQWRYINELVTRAYPVDERELVDGVKPDRLEAFAQSRGPMAIVGPPGVGREFTARRIHSRSEVDGLFVVLDCGTLPEAVVLPELCGEGDLPGRLAAAEGGTLCIRDLSSLSASSQVAVLEVVKGAPTRLILIERGGADSNELPGSITRAVDEAVLRLGPLHERPDTVEQAARYYLHQTAMSLGRLVTDFTPEALSWLRAQSWPSNFHSLIACVRDGVVRSQGEQVGLSDLRPALAEAPADGALAETVEQVEREAVITALERSGGNKSQAARLLGMKRTTYVRKLAKYAPEL